METPTEPQRAFGLIIIGDELLLGSRQDQHLPHFRELLKCHGYQLDRCWFLTDTAESLIRHLRFSFEVGQPVFVCGGIGATPDDLTRGCAARAAGVELTRHPEATALIEARFAESAYPERIRMADLPAGGQLIPNPYNQIPGFSLRGHHFLPGFPEMAWPMARWVLDTHYPQATDQPLQTLKEQSVRVYDTPESSLIPLMLELSKQFPDMKMFSLPHLGEEGYVELGFRGEGDIETAMEALRKALDSRMMAYQQG
jgi:molybdopterin-biosynthesis enzyme MoeA-like protein